MWNRNTSREGTDQSRFPAGSVMYPSRETFIRYVTRRTRGLKQPAGKDGRASGAERPGLLRVPATLGLGQVTLSNPDRGRRDFDELVVGDPGDGSVERHIRGGPEVCRLVGSVGADVGQ